MRPRGRSVLACATRTPSLSLQRTAATPSLRLAWRCMTFPSARTPHSVGRAVCGRFWWRRRFGGSVVVQIRSLLLRVGVRFILPFGVPVSGVVAGVRGGCFGVGFVLSGRSGRRGR